jgi:CDP-glycerol glycerophosphotransferase (TagB/SpsB family)
LVHYVLSGRQSGRQIFPSLANVRAIAAVVKEASLFSAEYYLANNDDVRMAGVDPLRHYCRFGWKELRKPNAWFDGWWYSVTYLSGLAYSVDPLLHYALVGMQAGLLTMPRKEMQNTIGTGFQYPTVDKRVRRVCLFAAYDVDGQVDTYVLEYLAHLSQYADIYYLADCEMDAPELAKLGPFVKGAWACRHKMYDFGSYSLLAKKYVGWDVIDQYDELIFANDSCFLVGDFGAVFSSMDRRQCDWWGLQATKGMSATRAIASNQFSTKVDLATVKSSMLSQFEDDHTYDFHIGSYFLCYRKPVMAHAGFRHLLNSVKLESSKKVLIQRYEIGFTKYLINNGFEFDTFISDLYPFHPLFSHAHFELLKQGLPLFKRFFLTENHYRVPGLARWREQLQACSTRPNIAAIEANLKRVANAEKLYANLHIGSDGRSEAEKMLTDAALVEADAVIAKNDRWWVFPVCGYNHTLGGNERAVFEYVKNDPAIKKIILTRSRHVELEGENVVVLPLRSAAGQQYLLRSGVIFIKHTPARNIGYPLRTDCRQFVNLWHGIPLKRIGAASLDQQHNLEYLYREHKKCSAVIASSKTDQMAMAAAFYPLTFNDVWVTGLPRNDFVVCADAALPADMQGEINAIRSELDGRRLVFYAPTFRNGDQDAYFTFTPAEKAFLKELLEMNNCVLGIREHLADKNRGYSAQLKDIGAVNLGDKRYANIEIIYRCADVLITDYSSCFIDFLLTGKPVISFAYDYDRYISEERGLFYDMPKVFPGAICKDFAALCGALLHALGGKGDGGEKYAFSRSVFFDFDDDRNCERLVKQVQINYKNGVA